MRDGNIEKLKDGKMESNRGRWEIEGGLWYMFILQHKNCNLYGKNFVLLSLVFIFIDFFITSYF